MLSVITSTIAWRNGRLSLKRSHDCYFSGSIQAPSPLVPRLHLRPTIGLLFSVWITLQGCDPGYWVGVRANLKEPLSPGCIEDALHKLPEIDRITVYKAAPRDATYLLETSKPEQVPDQYMFEAGQEKGLITQFQKQEGRTSFLAGIDATGVTPSEEQAERIQRFNARIAVQVAQRCNARFLDDSRFMCFPDRAGCRLALQMQMSK